MKFADRLKFTATGTNAATITVAAAVAACRTLAQAIADGALVVGDTGVPFTVTDGTNWEDSLFTVTSSTVLTRTSVLASSAGGTTAATFSGTLTVFNATPGSYLTGQTVNVLTDATLAGGMYLLVTDASGNAFRASLSALQSFLGTTGTPSESLIVNNPGAQTAAVAFSVSGTYSNASTTPSALDYSINGGSTWSAASSPTITPTTTGAGTFSFGGVTVPSANASQTVMVRDHLNQTVTATSASFAVSAASTPATGVTLTGPTNGAVSVASTNFTVGVTPVGGTITGTVVVTPSDNGGGGSFNPATVSLTSASPTGTFTYTPSSTAGARTISVTNNGSLTNPANITYTSTSAVTPTLTNATATATSSTAASYSVTTNEANGTLYRLFSTNATETATTIKAANLTQAVTTAGAQTGNTTVALNPTTTYYGHFVYVDGAGATSAVADTASFITPAAGTMASQYNLTSGTGGANVNVTPATMTVSGNDRYAASGTVRMMVETAGGVPLANAANLKFVWGKLGNPCPTVFSSGSIPAGSGNGNIDAHAAVTGTVKYAGWANPGDSFYGCFAPDATLFAWGTPGTYVLWAMFSDGSTKMYDNNQGQGNPITWTLS